jgi:hypothetical protein
MWVGGSAKKQPQTNIWTAIYHTSITTVYIPIRESESVNRRMTDNTTALRKRGKGYLRWSPLIEVATNKEVIEPSVPIG